MDIVEAVSSLNSDIWGVWFLAGAALVFWMQAGFAMVEAGFTRAKNTGNIIMKNLMDFCIGTVMWFVIGASFMLSYTDPTTGEVVFGALSVNRDLRYLLSMLHLTFQDLCSTWCSVPQRRLLFPVQWQNVQSSAHTVSIQQSFRESSIRLKPTGHGVADSLPTGDSTIMQVQHVSTWLVVYVP